MGSHVNRPERPILAFALTLMAGVLVLLEGIFLTALSSVIGSAGQYAAGAILGDAGAVGLIIGFILILLAVALFVYLDSHVGIGVLILIFSFLSIFGGGGFYLGLILGIIGGIAAILFDPWLYVGPAASHDGFVSSRRTCPACGAAIPVQALACPQCGRPAARP